MTEKDLNLLTLLFQRIQWVLTPIEIDWVNNWLERMRLQFEMQKAQPPAEAIDG